MEVCFAGARRLLVLHVAKVFLASRAKNRDQITAAAEANEVLRRMGATLGHIQDIHFLAILFPRIPMIHWPA
ncbi:hypothetical protein RHE_CH03178 [Rhizobium etli CFN 42]|uniref:Uncharacterized protein n=1 Tax=Rhizobium etli (strain ATCC 51251 / DSM 11541 / JCM 21823 / NBRC 15573 / CFN 42) TaxID=347834 RepID=Q2K5E3_RHIEC|nr:hypothetical protein RHE_CH03178 [Rhizobium etli CFN 42]